MALFPGVTERDFTVSPGRTYFFLTRLSERARALNAASAAVLALSSLLQSPRETAILALSTSSLWRKLQRERPFPQFGWPTEDAACWARTAKIGADGWPRARQWKLSALAERRSRWFNQLLERLTSAWMPKGPSV